ncbi:MAG: hydantoinase/oxoprolinase family protein [Candidatus Sericytochromatia bacterium]|nr:hydantoinase/oxoprolinase family protein [Candidatus Sericytochromatia bacterium]
MIAGIDTGGTFTDCVGFEQGLLRVQKVVSCPTNPAKAVLMGLNALQTESPLPITSLVHGTTVATNALLERKLARTALIITAGFKDLLSIGRQNRPMLYALHSQLPAPLVGGEDIFEIDERIGSQGEIIRPLHQTEIQACVEALPAEIEAVSLCLLFSYRNPLHEQLLAAALRKQGYRVSASHEILPEYREYERFSTTTANACLMPIMQKYMASLVAGLGELPCRLIQSNGGSLHLNEVADKPVSSVLSGPAGGLIGAWETGKRLSETQLLTLDMGGTSTDVALLNGELPLQTEAVISGIPIKLPMLAIHTVGAGGGSLINVDAGGALRVGPESAGADPGPLCYGKGKMLTVTDAQVFLGRIPATSKLGGHLALQTAPLQAAFENLGQQLGISAQAVALGALMVANARMERALRVVSVEKGQNPAEFNLFCFGGAGGLHACELAESLGIPKITIPAHAGVFSALGMLYASEIRDYARTVLGEIHWQQKEDLDLAFERLRSQAEVDFQATWQDLKLQASLDLRYPGQSYELNLPYSPASEADFHALHLELHHFARPELSPELVTLRLRVSRELPQPDLLPPLAQSQVLNALFIQKVGFAQGLVETPFYERSQLPADVQITGPAIILEDTATTLVAPGWRARLHAMGHLCLEQDR